MVAELVPGCGTIFGVGFSSCCSDVYPLETVAVKQLDRALPKVQWDCLMLDEVDDVTIGLAAGCRGPTGASRWMPTMGAVTQLSGEATSAEISTDGAINVQLGAVQLCFVLIILCTGGEETGIPSQMLYEAGV